MGAGLGSEAISHLEEISPEGITAMAASGSVAVILPTTAYILRLPSPPVRAMIDQGVIVALGSDFNPNAHCLSMVRLLDLLIARKIDLPYIYPSDIRAIGPKRLIKLEIPVPIRSLKSSNVELG